MPQPLPSAVQSYLNNASLEELTATMHQLYRRMCVLESPQAEIEQFCSSRRWTWSWFPHPGIPGAVFLCIRYKNKYREFLGYNRQLGTACNLAAIRALHYFKGQSRYAYHQHKRAYPGSGFGSTYFNLGD